MAEPLNAADDVDPIAAQMKAEQDAADNVVPIRPDVKTEPAPADEDPIAAQMKREQDQETDLQAQRLRFLSEHSDMPPERAAEVSRLSAASGVPPETVNADLEGFRKKASGLPKEFWDRVAYRQPGLVKMLDAEPQAMPLVKDDTANLHGIEWALGKGWSIPGIISGRDFFNGAPAHAFADAVGEQTVIARQFVQANPRLLDAVTGDAEDIGDFHISKEDKRAALERENAAAIAEGEKKFSKDYGDSNFLSTATIATMRMIPFIAGDMLARAGGGAAGAFLGGGTAAAGGAETGPGEAVVVPAGAGLGAALGQFGGSAAFNYYQAVGPAHERFSEMKGADGKPLDPGLVDAMTQATAVTSATLMAAGGSIIGKSAGALAKPLLTKLAADAIEKAMVQPGIAGIAKRGLLEFGKDWLTGAMLMGAQGGVNQLAVEGAQVAADQHLTLKDVANNPNTFALDVAAQGNLGKVAGAMGKGFVGGLQDMWLLSAFGAAKGHGVEFLRELGRDHNSAENALRYETFIAGAKDSKLLKRSPEMFEKAVDKMAEAQGDNGKLYVPLEKWVSYWQTKKADPAQVAASVMADGGKGYAEALTSKGDLAIKKSQFARAFATTEHAEGLAPDVKMRAEDLTPNQMKAAQDDYKQRVKDLVKRNPDFEADRGEVRKFIRDMAVAAGHSREEANANARLTEDFVTALAVKGNISIREAARQANLGQLRIVGPKGEKALAAARERFDAFLTPRAEEHLDKRLESLSPETRPQAMANEVHLDRVSGLRNRSVFEETPAPAGKQVAVISSPDVKGINEHPTHGGHGITDEMLRVMGAAIGEKHPEAAREGTSFLVHVSSDAELRDLVEKARKALGNEHLQPLVSATGPDSEAAFKALDKETARRRSELKSVEGEPPPLPVKPEDKLLERGKLNPKLDVGAFGEALKANPARGKATVPPELVEKMRGLTNEQYAKHAYADRVSVGGKDEATGLLSRNGWDAIPRKRHAAMIDLRGLKAANQLGESIGIGKDAGNKMLFAFADLVAHLGGAGFDASHLSGDEYALQHDDPAELQRFVERLTDATKRLRVVAEDPVSGEKHRLPVDFRHGIGTDLIAADRELSSKKSREPKQDVAGVGREADNEPGRRPRDDAAQVQGAPEQGAPAVGEVAPQATRGRGGARFFQRDVVDYIEGQPVVFSHGDPEQDASFEFGENERRTQIGEYVAGLPADQQDAAKEFVAYCEGAEGAKRPQDLPPQVEKDLAAQFELVDPVNGFTFDEQGRDMARPLGGRKVFNALPESLANWKQNNSGRWWMRYITPSPKRTKYKQFPRPEQSLEQLQAQQVFTDLAVAHGAKVVDSVDSLVDILKKQIETLPERARKRPLIFVALHDRAQHEFRDVKEAEKFVREFHDQVDWVGTEPLNMDLRREWEDRRIEQRDANRAQNERLGMSGYGAGEIGRDVQPEVVRSRDTAEALGREYLQDREGRVRPVDEIPESKNLPGQAEAEAAPRPSEAVGAQPITPEGYTGMLVLRAGGHEPGEKARGEISMQLDPNGRPRTFRISAFAGDKSTLAHEMSHFLSWSFHDVAESDLATPQQKADYAALLKWAGIGSAKDRLFNAKRVDELQQKGELSRSEMAKVRELSAGEERISHGFEQYLAEGKAPTGANAGLARVFSKFREWMLGIYRGVQGIQQQYRQDYGAELNLSNDVRDIFARLLGQEDALNQARRDTGQPVEGPRPPPLPTAGMTPEEREAFTAAMQASKVHEERDIARRMAELQGEQTDDIRAEVAQDVTKELDQKAIYRAQRFLQLGELVDAQGNRIDVPDVLLDEKGRPYKLDRKAFVKEFGKDVTALMPRAIWGKDGAKADELAPLLGFHDGAEMVDAFRAVPHREKAIAQETQSRVSEIYAPAQEAIQKAAMSAVHNEHSAHAALIQLRALARQVDPATEARVKALDPRVMRATAERLVNETGVGDLDPEQYATAEKQAAAEAARLEAKGNAREAVIQREARLFNQMLYRAARDAAEKAAHIEDKLKGTSDAVRANLGKADPSYRDLHDAILAAVGLGPAPTGDVQGIDAFMAKATADGHDPNEAFDLDGIKKALDGKYDWDQLSVAEASNVADALKYIRHVAHETNTVEVEGKRFGLAEYLRSVAERVASVQKPQPRMPYSRTAEGFKEKGRRARRGAQGLLENMETWAEMLDGGTKGPMHDLVIKSYVERRTVENGLNKDVLKPIKEAWENVPKEIRKLKDRVEPGLADLLPVPANAGTLEPVYTRDMLWRLFMAYGSEGNRQRLNTGNGWSNENIEKALSRLTPPELDFLQTVKDSINGLYPKLAEAYEKRTGLKLGKVDALPVTINGKTYAGGYDPIRYDSRISSQGEKQEAQAIKDLFSSQYQKPTLPNSATKSRVEKVDAPLDLSWGVVPAHLSQVIRDISYGEWARMVGRVMLAKSPKGVEVPTFKETTTKFLGEERAKLMIPWLQDVVNARADSAATQQSNFLRTIGNGARSTLARIALGFNFPSLARHLFDPYSTLADSDAVLPHNVFAAYVKVWNPGNWNRPEYSASKELSNHEAQLNENLRQELANIGPGSQGALSRAFTSVAFYAHGVVHHFTARVVFTAGHDQALSQGATPEEAIEAGDDLVRRHIPSGDIATKPPLLRTKYGAAASVMYYGYANLMHNVRARAFDEVVRAYEGPNSTTMDAATATAKFAGKWIGLGMVGAVGTYFAGRAWKKKDDTPGGAAAWLGEEVGLDPVDGLPFGFGAAIKGLTKGIIHKDWPHEFDIANAPELAFAEDVFNRVQKGIQRAQSGGSKSETDKLWGMAEFLATALAGAEGNRVMGNITAQRKGEYRPRGALGQAEGGLYGAPKKDPGESAVNPLHHVKKALDALNR